MKNNSYNVWDPEIVRVGYKKSLEACEQFFAARKRPKQESEKALYDLCLAEYEVRTHLLAVDCLSSRESLISELQRLLAEPLTACLLTPCDSGRYFACQREDIELQIQKLAPTSRKRLWHLLTAEIIFFAMMSFRAASSGVGGLADQDHAVPPGGFESLTRFIAGLH
jgi:hypothetical protein